MNIVNKIENIKIDMWLFIPSILISVFGLLILYSASGQSLNIVENQIFKLCIGFGLMIGVSQINPIKIRVMSYKFYVISVFLLVCVLFFGHTSMGATRWLNLGFIILQPSEFLKLSLPMMLGWLIYKHGMPTTIKSAGLFSFLIILPVFLVLNQPDLGTSILIILSGLYLLFQAGLNYHFIAYSISFIFFSSPLLWYSMKEYQQQRILTMFNPESDPLNSGYHIIQSKTAISSGGLSGKGYLEGTQTQLGFIPEQKTDFIFAVLSEEFGFKGFMLIIFLYSILLLRMFFIIKSLNDIYQKVITGSVMMTLFSYIFVNIGMVTGIIPVVGVPLPLVSFGGTSIVILLISLGIVSSFSTNINSDKDRIIK
jgi:rod shape determining protein RodA